MFKAVTIALLAAALTSACVKKEESNVVSGGSASPSSPMFWSGNPFPLNIYLSDAFTTQQADAIKRGGNSWETALGGKNWFDFNPVAQHEVTNSAFSGDALGRDNQIVVYKTTQWQSDRGVIAYAQNMVTAYNEGTSSEYRIISSSDIMVNFRDNTFRDAVVTTGDYDLETVILHEFGHMLGLLHTDQYPSSNKNTSVMYPSIGRGDTRRTPFQPDKNKLAGLYNLNPNGSNISGASASAGAPMERYVPFDDGREIMIQIELRKTGECVHKENGVIVHRHHSPNFK